MTAIVLPVGRLSIQTVLAGAVRRRADDDVVVAAYVATSVAHRVLPPGEELPDELRIGHLMGVTDVLIEVDPEIQGADLRFAALGFVRTARRLMDGTAYVPADE